MAGITDAPFRDLAWQYGAGYVVGEMQTVRSELWDTHKSRLRRVPGGGEPRVVQLAGAHPEQVAEAARAQVRCGAQIIDLNFGCPMKKVCRKASGSALLREPKLVERIVRAVVTAVDVPVTVKMRTGWDASTRNAPELAVRLEQAGVAAITVHGRTREDRFVGAVEYDTIAAVKARVAVPVIANGDIASRADAHRVRDYTGADGVMIGRACLGAPWLPGVIAGVRPVPDAAEQLVLAGAHVRALHAFYGLPRGIGVARKHVGAYLRRLQLGDRVREFNGFTAADDQLSMLEQIAA